MPDNNQQSSKKEGNGKDKAPQNTPVTDRATDDNFTRVWRPEQVWWGREDFPQGAVGVRDDNETADPPRGRGDGATEGQNQENTNNNAAPDQTNTGERLTVPQQSRPQSYERVRNPASAQPRNMVHTAEWLAREREGKNTGDERYRDYFD